MKTMEATEEVSSDGMEKRVERGNWLPIKWEIIQLSAAKNLILILGLLFMCSRTRAGTAGPALSKRSPSMISSFSTPIPSHLKSSGPSRAKVPCSPKCDAQNSLNNAPSRALRFPGARKCQRCGKTVTHSRIQRVALRSEDSAISSVTNKSFRICIAHPILSLRSFSRISGGWLDTGG
jgi:hypothetical protein